MAKPTVAPITLGKIYHVKDGDLSVIVYAPNALDALGKAYQYVYGGQTHI